MVVPGAFFSSACERRQVAEPMAVLQVFPSEEDGDGSGATFGRSTAGGGAEAAGAPTFVMFVGL